MNQIIIIFNETETYVLALESEQIIWFDISILIMSIRGHFFNYEKNNENF